MATQALYNKWRAQTFDQVLGQEHITRTLRNQIKAGRIGHAYLFTGLRGTGKTSTARILAKAVNCVGDVAEPPCNACPICRSITQSASLDLIEIDAASNRGIDEIRDLRDRVHFVPHQCRYKVYVIDEVHMLTTEAFNALLKTLEEPPPHVIFVLCTTEPHRLPDTILSRCQRFDFRRISVETLVHKLRLISKEEGIAVAPDALEFIARRATGSFRDAESLLDQLAVYGADEITLDLVQRALGSVSWALVCRLVEALVRGDIPTGLRAINQAMDAGAEPRQFLSDILDHLRALLYLGVGGDESLEYLGVESLAAMRALASRDGFSLGAIVRAIRLFNEAGQGLRGAARPQLPLELALVESVLVADGDAAQGPSSRSRGQPEPAVGAAVAPGPAAARGASEAVVEVTPAPPAGNRPPVGALTAEAKAPPRAISAEPPARAASAPTPESETAQANREMVAEHTVEAPTPEEPAARQEISLEWVRNHWPLFLLKVNLRSKQVRALLNSAYPVSVRSHGGGAIGITLGCEASFHRDMLSDDKRRTLLEEALSEALGVPCHVECAVQAGVQGLLRPSAGSPEGPSADMFDAERTARQSEQELLSHPIVKELQRRGGRITSVRVYDQDETGG